MMCGMAREVGMRMYLLSVNESSCDVVTEVWRQMMGDRGIKSIGLNESRQRGRADSCAYLHLVERSDFALVHRERDVVAEDVLQRGWPPGRFFSGVLAQHHRAEPGQ